MDIGRELLGKKLSAPNFLRSMSDGVTDRLALNRTPLITNPLQKEEKSPRIRPRDRRVERPKQLAGETIMHRVRMHWIVHVPAIMIFGVFSGITVALTIYHQAFTEMLNLAPHSWISIVLVLFVLSSAIISNSFLIWFYNYYIITDCRIMHFRIKNGFHYEAEEIMLDRIKYVDVRRPSLIALIINYGHLELGVDLNTDISIFRIRWIKSPHQLMHDLNKII